MQYRKIKATYRVNTPLFMSGSDIEKAELRAPSIKGVLRFWFRATACSNDFTEVKKAEQCLFGSTDTGQGKFLIRVNSNNLKTCKRGEHWKQAGSAYLGYGVINWDGKARKVLTTSSYISPGTVFTVELIFRPSASLEDLESIKRSLIALGLFGGLGARSRRGFGSVSLESLLVDEQEKWKKPNSRAELLEQINKFIAGLGSLPADLPEYSAFSKNSRVAIVLEDENSLNLLNTLGEEMMRYRSYGRVFGDDTEHKVLGKKAEQNFAADHDLILNFARTGQATAHPERLVFGLPHNYYFSNKIKVDVNAENFERRASPLLMHIHALKDGYTAVLTLLPASFLPGEEKIKLEHKESKNEVCVPTDVDYEVINDFINRFDDSLEVTIQ